MKDDNVNSSTPYVIPGLKAPYTPEELLAFASNGEQRPLDELLFGVSSTADCGGDNVNSPAHYAVLGDIEVIEVIIPVLKDVYGPQAFQAYCLGNILKYRLRAGQKGNDNATEDLAKADRYREMAEAEIEDEAELLTSLDAACASAANVTAGICHTRVRPKPRWDEA